METNNYKVKASPISIKPHDKRSRKFIKYCWKRRPVLYTLIIDQINHDTSKFIKYFIPICWSIVVNLQIISNWFDNSFSESSGFDKSQSFAANFTRHYCTIDNQSTRQEILLFIDAKIIVKLLWKAPILKEQFYLLGAENKTFGNPTTIFSFSFGSKTKILSRITLLTLSTRLAKSRTSFHFTKFFILQVKFKHRHIQCNKW